MSQRPAVVSFPPQSHRTRPRGLSMPDVSLGRRQRSLVQAFGARRGSENVEAAIRPLSSRLLGTETQIRRIYVGGHDGREEGKLVSNGCHASLDSLEGGQCIDFQLAVVLRKLVCGSTIHTLSTDFKNSVIRFQSADGPFAFGLVGDRNGARRVIMCIQAHVLKYLIFQHSSRETIRQSNVLKPKENDRRQTLISSLADILWRAGQGTQATVCLPQKKDCFTTVDRKYRKDGITERLRIFNFQSCDKLKDFISKHLTFFEEITCSGVLLFIYSVVLSRTIDGVKEDLGDGANQLLTDNEQCSQALLNLLLTGHAVPYLHNGDVAYNEFAELLTIPERGIQERSELGFLFYHNEESDKNRTQVGSMLKTPKLPIWVTLVNGHPGVIFSLNPDLVNDWRAEHKFSLHYYTGLLTQTKDAVLHVDTRIGRQLQSKTKEGKRQEEKRVPVLEKCVMTKWPGAHIEWEGSMLPFVT